MFSLREINSFTFFGFDWMKPISRRYVNNTDTYRRARESGFCSSTGVTSGTFEIQTWVSAHVKILAPIWSVCRVS